MHLIDSWNGAELNPEETKRSVNLAVVKLQATGVIAGDRVIMVASSSSQWLVIYSALTTIGAIIIPIDLEDKIELGKKISIANPHYILAIDLDDDVFSDAYHSINFDFENVALYENKEKHLLSHNDEICHLMIFTSGTGGASKLAMLDEAAVNQVVNFYVNEYSQYDFNKIIIALPLSAIYTICISLAAIKAQKQLVFVKPKEQDIFAVIKEYNVDLFPAVPLVAEAIYNKINENVAAKSKFVQAVFKLLLVFSTQARRLLHFNIGRYIFSSIHHAVGASLKVILSGGAKIPKHVLYDMYGYGFTIYEGYGLTETSGVVTVRRGEYASIGSVGSPINDVEVKLGSSRDENEILLKTKQAYSGYFDASTGVTNSNSDWVETGDAGFLDASGNLHINGRLKNVITFSNEMKISPELLEEALQKACDVSDPVIIGFNKDESFGDHVVLFVEKREWNSAHNNNVDLDSINASYIAPYFINEVVYMDAFPRNKLGKCCRNKLIEQYLGVE